MFEKVTEALLHAGLDVQAQALRGGMEGAAIAGYLHRHLAGGMGIPAVRALVGMQQDVAGLGLGVLRGEKEPLAAGSELFARTVSAARYQPLVQTWGKQLFGSASRKGEKLLGEDAHFTLTYFPRKAGGKAGPPVFHVGGVMPYGDKLFRLMPENSFFDRFTERGMPVYAMELKGDRFSHDYHDLTLEKLIDAISHLSGLAFDHAEGRKMVLEGYCALATHAHAYVAARPLEANSRFRVVATFVGPVDGRQCTALADAMKAIPPATVEATHRLAELAGDYLGGDNLRLTQDLALDGLFGKTALGRFATGWSRPEYAGIDSIEQLTPDQRRDLCGTYWISPENCRRFPVPVDLARYSSAIFTRGVSDDGVLPANYRGRPLSLREAAKGTELEFVGFFGANDVLVPEQTAAPLKAALGDRYRHVVHPNVGHVSYIFSPKVWGPGPKSLDPNPIDVVLEAYGKE